MARTNEWTECLVDWVDGRLRQNRFSNLWLGGGPGADGGSSYRPIDGQLTQRHVCYDTSEDASPCSPSGFSSLIDNLRRIRYWQEPATWFGAETTSGLKITIKPGLWYPSTTEYCAFAGGDSPTFTLPSGVLDRIDTVYIDPSGILHIQRGTPAVLPTITLPPIASGIPLWAVYLPPSASGVYFQVCSGYYAGQAYIERDLRPFLNLGGGGVVGSGVLPPHNRGAILRGGVADWETYNVGAANEVLTNDGTDVMWSSKSLVIEENSILNQDLTTDASVTFADVFVPDGGTFGISGNELLTANAAGNFTFSGVTSIVVPDGAWVGADTDCAWLFNSTSGYVTTQDTTGVGTTAPEGMLDVAYGGYLGKMTLLLGADMNAITRTNVTSKRTLVGSYHYTNAEEPVGMMYVFSSSIVNRLDIGGGSIYCNAATEVSIYTAADTTTVTGTKRFSIDDTGAIIVTGPSLEVPDEWWVGIGAAAERIVIDSAGYIAFRGCNVSIGLAIPNQKLTVEGTMDLKEQAAAGADVASYGQIWVKDAAPNELWFTDDDGTDIQLGVGGGGLPNVAGVGYALVSDGVNSWVADQTPAWTGEHSFIAGIALTGATGVNAITIPDNLANALHIIDAGDADVYLQIVTTTGSEEVIFNAGGDDVDFRVEAVGQANALFVQGSDGCIGMGIGAPSERLHIRKDVDGAVELRIENQTAGGSAMSRINLISNSASGSLSIYDDAIGAPFTDVTLLRAFDTATNLVLMSSNAGGYINFFTGGAAVGNERVRIDSAGSVGIGTATPQGELDVSAAQPDIVLTWTNTANYARYMFYENAVSRGSIQVLGSTFATVDRRYNMEFYTAHPDGDITFYPNGIEEVRFEAGGNVGIGTTGPVRELHVGNGADATFQVYPGITANFAGNAQVSARNSTNNVEVGMVAYTNATYMGAWTNHPLNIRTNNVNRIEIAAGGQVKITNLAGAGVRNVVAAADGTLSAP